jgi:hypothetical protein
MRTYRVARRSRAAGLLPGIGCAILAAGAAGCSESSEPTAPADETGAYVLQSVDGAALPIRWVYYDADTVDMLADTLILGPDGVRERKVLSYRGPDVAPYDSTPTVYEVPGSYARSGDGVNLYFSRRGVTECTLSRRGGRVTLRCVIPGTLNIWVYTR